ncbi:CoA pyrophosphatase [Rheinheimera riviphila]|uniref:CoA pyrophosphatase n=1 Tax=Rheinheimera riviphila TaxID=1834037 RepID=A0A437QT45_9GAMM|nr:CoA pyrophosphatase [Rheinheimera riviphila]RVU37672.1 CoA pyrophosphatase [Rheinheimera riviphila]
MTLEQWLPRFLLQRQPAAALLPPANAAVMLLLWPEQQQLQLLLTRRAMHLRHHPGQISFPGGRIETGETAVDAALRETEEEVGVSAATIKILGSLPAMSTSTGFVVSPWLGLLGEPPTLRLQTTEVAAAFSLPLSYALSNEYRKQRWFSQPYRQQQLHFLPFQDQLIWGATAAILHQLAEQIQAP